VSGANIAAGFKLNRPEISSNFRMTIVIVPVRKHRGALHHYCIGCWNGLCCSSVAVLVVIRRLERANSRTRASLRRPPVSTCRCGVLRSGLHAACSFADFTWNRN